MKIEADTAKELPCNERERDSGWQGSGRNDELGQGAKEEKKRIAAVQ